GMGVLAEHVRQLPQAQRSSHPLQSIAAVGRDAADLAQRDTPCAFDPGSAFDRMLALDFKLLLLGASVQSVSMIHYCEQQAQVPYRFWKDFTGQARLQPPAGNGEWQTHTYRMFARDLQLDPRIDISPVQRALEERGLWRSRPLNYGRVALCRLADFASVALELLAADPWVLVANRPD
ncbi:MAG: AAC(3) family N-acetyltransferase, partial [Anaerolineales bacterium]|nr:AAC(3) family N-acetyltransferase [Anaerolineales bacterium]